MGINHSEWRRAEPRMGTGHHRAGGSRPASALCHLGVTIGSAHDQCPAPRRRLAAPRQPPDPQPRQLDRGGGAALGAAGIQRRGQDHDRQDRLGQALPVLRHGGHPLREARARGRLRRSTPVSACCPRPWPPTSRTARRCSAWSCRPPTGALGCWREEYDASTSSAAHALLGALGAAHLVDRSWGTLSSGERKRVELARALMPDPEMLSSTSPPRGWTWPVANSSWLRSTEIISSPDSPSMSW